MMIEGLRDFAKKRKWVTLVVACVPVALAAIFTSAHFLPAAQPEWPMAYYFDEAIGETTIRPSSDLPPLRGATGQLTVVRAVYLTPSDVAHKFLGYLEKFDDATLTRLHEPAKSNLPSVLGTPDEILVRLPKEGSPWLISDSLEGSRLLHKVYNPDPNGPPLRQCPP